MMVDCDNGMMFIQKLADKFCNDVENGGIKIP